MGPQYKTKAPEEWLEHVQLRVLFEGWKIGNARLFRPSLQFYTDSSFTEKTVTKYRVHLDYLPEKKFRKNGPDVKAYAYFRVKEPTGRGWRMRYEIGIYGSYHAGIWKHVTAT